MISLTHERILMRRQGEFSITYRVSFMDTNRDDLQLQIGVLISIRKYAQALVDRSISSAVQITDRAESICANDVVSAGVLLNRQSDK